MPRRRQCRAAGRAAPPRQWPSAWRFSWLPRRWPAPHTWALAGACTAGSPPAGASAPRSSSGSVPRRWLVSGLPPWRGQTALLLTLMLLVAAVNAANPGGGDGQPQPLGLLVGAAAAAVPVCAGWLAACWAAACRRGRRLAMALDCAYPLCYVPPLLIMFAGERSSSFDRERVCGGSGGVGWHEGRLAHCLRHAQAPSHS